MQIEDNPVNLAVVKLRQDLFDHPPSRALLIGESLHPRQAIRIVSVNHVLPKVILQRFLASLTNIGWTNVPPGGSEDDL